MTEPAGFMKCGLHGRPANSGARRHFVDRLVAYPMVLYFSCNYAQDCALSFREALP
jgi:hypothetical protein